MKKFFSVYGITLQNLKTLTYTKKTMNCTSSILKKKQMEMGRKGIKDNHHQLTI